MTVTFKLLLGSCRCLAFLKALLLKRLGCHAELAEEQFAEIRRRIDANHVAYIAYAVLALLEKLCRLFQFDKSDEFHRREVEQRLDAAQQRASAHAECVGH